MSEVNRTKFFSPELEGRLSLVVVDGNDRIYYGYTTSCCQKPIVGAFHGRTVIMHEERSGGKNNAMRRRNFFCRPCMIKTIIQLDPDGELPVDEEMRRRLDDIKKEEVYLRVTTD